MTKTTTDAQKEKMIRNILHSAKLARIASESQCFTRCKNCNKLVMYPAYRLKPVWCNRCIYLEKRQLNLDYFDALL